MSEEEQTEEENPKFTVNDRRHWVDESEEAGSEETEERLPSYVEQLKKDAEEKDKRLREYIAAYKTKTAETDEFRQRLQRENDVRLDQFKAKFFEKLLPMVDNLQRALHHAQTSNDPAGLTQGIEMTLGQIKKQLNDEGVEMITAKGQSFDPSRHEALMMSDTEDPAQDNMVLEDLEPGYMFKEKLIKPAKVNVAKLKSTS